MSRAFSFNTGTATCLPTENAAAQSANASDRDPQRKAALRRKQEPRPPRALDPREGAAAPAALGAAVLRTPDRLAPGADRQIRGQPARSRTPAAARPGGNWGLSKSCCGAACRRPGEMKLHCEVEVVSRHLPALGLRNRGKGVRAVLSLCQQAPQSQPRPGAGAERGGPPPPCLLISTLKDKRGTRYEVRGAGRRCQGVSRGAPPRSRQAAALGPRTRPRPRPQFVLGVRGRRPPSPRHTCFRGSSRDPKEGSP